MGKRDSTKFGVKISFELIFYIAQPPESWWCHNDGEVDDSNMIMTKIGHNNDGNKVNDEKTTN